MIAVQPFPIAKLDQNDDGEPTDLSIQFPDGTSIEGGQTLVLLGPNGSGKSRLGAKIADQNSGIRVAAVRSLNIHERVLPSPRSVSSQVNQNTVLQSLRRNNKSPAKMDESLNDILRLFAEEYIAKQEERLMHFEKTETLLNIETRLQILESTFSCIFPDVTLQLYRKNSERAIANHTNMNEYAASDMSDGEKYVLYVIAVLLVCPSSIIVVDEPESHLHPLLARLFWDTVEQCRPDCRFVYLTHDLSFSASRLNAQIGLVRSHETVELLPIPNQIPADVYKNILGAATFTFIAKKIIFCEGDTKSTDSRFFEAWFSEERTFVIPAGSCENVVKCVETLSELNFIAGACFLGFIDRDYHQESFFCNMDIRIRVLPVHEIEGIFCLPQIFLPVCIYLGKSEQEGNDLYEDALASCRKHLRDQANKTVIERVKSKISELFFHRLNNLKPGCDFEQTKSEIESFDINSSGFFEEEYKAVQQALLFREGEEFFKILPAKGCVCHFAQKAGLKNDREYINIILKALRGYRDECGNAPIHDLGNQIRKRLGSNFLES